MNTKKNNSVSSVVLLAIIALCILTSSCEKDEDSYYLYSGKTNLEFGYNTNSINLNLSNLSDEAIQWSISSTDDFLAFSDPSGSISAEGNSDVTISVRRELISADSISSLVQISSSKGEGLSIPVFIRNYPENKIRLSFRVTGSAFDENRQILYLLSTFSSSPRLEVYDVEEGTFTTHDLDISSYSNSATMYLMPDGNNLAITMGSNLYLFDVNEGIINYSLQFDAYITNTSGSPDQRLYISTQNYSDKLYFVDLSTKELFTVVINNLYGHYIQTHPSGDYLYGMHHYNGIIKLNISSTTPTLVYSDYQYEAAKMWIVDNGNRIITNEKMVLEINPDMGGNDIVSSSSIEVSGFQYISDVAYDASDDNYFVLFTNSDYYDEIRSLQRLNGSMDFMKVIEPEPFLENNGSGGYTSINAWVRTVYCNPENNTLVLITSSDPGNYPDYSAIEIISY